MYSLIGKGKILSYLKKEKKHLHPRPFVPENTL